MSSARVERLVNIRDNLETIVEAQTLAWITAGSPPDFSVDGESYTWTSWLSSKLDAIKTLNELIRTASPYVVRSRHRG